MTKPLILVTTAGGNTGAEVSKQLLERGHPIRAFVRSDDHRAAALRKAGADVFVGNLLDVRDLRASMAGVSRAYFTPPMGPNGLYTSMAFAIAAEEARLETVTTLSQWLLQPAHPSLATREQWMVDQVLPWMPHVDVVQLIPGWFAWTYSLVMAPIAQLGLMPMPLGQGRNAPPSERDTAAVAVETLIDPASHVGKTYRPTGPRLLAPEEIAGSFGRALGRDVHYRDISDALFAKAALAQGFPKWGISQIRHYVKEYRADSFALGAPTDVVLEVTGREPEDFDVIARRFVAERPEAKRSLGNRLSAVATFLRALVTPVPRWDEYEQQQDHAVVRKPELAFESREWTETHGGALATGSARGALPPAPELATAP